MQGLAPLYALLQCTGISTITCFKLADYLSCELSQIPSQPIANLLGAGLTRAQIAQLRADYTQPIDVYTLGKLKPTTLIGTLYCVLTSITHRLCCK